MNYTCTYIVGSQILFIVIFPFNPMPMNIGRDKLRILTENDTSIKASFTNNNVKNARK